MNVIESNGKSEVALPQCSQNISKSKGKHEVYPFETFLKTLLQIVSIDEGKFI